MEENTYIIVEGLNSIKDKLNHIDISGIVMYDPECIVGEKQFYESVFYSNIHPQEAVSFTDKMQLITKSIKLITDRTELDYLLGEIKDIKLLAKKSHDTYSYSFFFDIFLLACKIETYINEQINVVNRQVVKAPISIDQYIKLKEYMNIDLTYEVLLYAIENKKLPDGVKRSPWKSAVEAIRFGTIFNLKVSQLRKIFFVYTKDKSIREIKDNDKSPTDYSKLTEIFTTKK